MNQTKSRAKIKKENKHEQNNDRSAPVRRYGRLYRTVLNPDPRKSTQARAVGDFTRNESEWRESGPDSDFVRMVD